MCFDAEELKVRLVQQTPSTIFEILIKQACGNGSVTHVR